MRVTTTPRCGGHGGGTGPGCTARGLELLLLAALLLLSGSAPSSSTAAPERQADVDLDAAPWEFETDPRDVGVAEQWFSSKARPALERTLTSPGAWQAQGIGNETALMRNQYAGVGWYRKTLTVGAVPAGGSVWLWIGGAPGGVMRSANVWANGVHCGRHVGYLEPLEIELTPALDHTGGGLELAVAVDSRWNRTEDPLWGGGSMWNYGWDGYNFGGYGGMIGNAKLLVRQPTWIEDSVHVSCKDAGGGSWQCAVKFTVAGRVSGARVSLAICEWGSSSGGTGCIVGAQTAANASRMTLTLTIPNAKLWAPGTQAAQAALYVANLTLSVGGSSDASPATTRSTRFGVRSLDTNGPRILFNGEPLFLRGYGDDGQYGFTGAPPMDKGYYLAQLSGMRELGFNFIRFHTHSMPDVFHEAADELGFLCNPEFAMNYRVGCPFPGCVYNEEVHDTYNRSFASIVHRRSHHPSVFGYVLSNEIGFSAVPFAELYHFANEHDPERPCWFADGVIPIAGTNLTALACRDGRDDADGYCFVDVWVPCSNWGKTPYAPPYVLPEFIGSGVPVAELPVPMLLHEAFDARTFPRLESNLQSFEGGMLKAGAWLNGSIDKMRALGLLAENADWAFASEKRYNLHMKTYLESYRLDPAVSGYEWWLGYDWIAASNGLIGGHANNPRAKPGISNETLRNVQNEVVLLVKDPVVLQATGRRPGEFVPIEILLANWTFMQTPQWFGKDPRLSWAARVVGGNPLSNGSSSVRDTSIAQGEIGVVAVFGVSVPPVATAATIVVSVTLDISGERVAANEWSLAVFPETVARECPVPVFATPELLHAAQQVCSNAVAVPSSLAAESSPFVLLRHGGMSEEDVAGISRSGGFGVSLGPGVGSWPVCGKSVELATVAFVQPWWIASGTTGTLVYNTSLARMLGFAEAHSILDYGWMSVVEGGQAYVLDGLAADSASSVHIRAIPSGGVYATQLEYETTVSNTALVWEGQISTELGGSQGKGGRFLVSGLNLLNSSGLTPWLVTEPVADFAFDKLVSYAVSETAAGRTKLFPAGTARSQQSVVADAGEAKTCNVSGSFCPAGSEAACQKPVPNGGICNGNCLISTAVCLQEDAVLDALYPRLLATTSGSRMIGVVYGAAATPGPRPANNTFCPPATPGSILPVGPLKLVASGTVATLDPANGSTWLRLPMPQTKLKAGVYWIGALFESDITCFSTTVPAGGNTPMGPGSADAYIDRSFASGPLAEWTPTVGGGGFTVYATTRP